ncbi:MAG: hypothetical protein Q9171_001781 [Xanthocarpia ochracea]
MPQFWFPIWSLSRNDNGGTDRKALSSWAEEFLSYSNKSDCVNLSLSRESLSNFERIQQTALGQTLIKAWKTVFGLSDDKLYESLEALQSPRLGLQENDTSSRVDDVYSKLESRHNRHAIADSIEREIKRLDIPQTALRRVCRVSSMQRVMFLAESNPTLYVTQAILYLRGELSALHMAVAWRAVCVAHPAMDTTFARVLYDDELSFFSIELAPWTLSEPARIVTDSALLDGFETTLKGDRE